MLSGSLPLEGVPPGLQKVGERVLSCSLTAHPAARRAQVGQRTSYTDRPQTPLAYRVRG